MVKNILGILLTIFYCSTSISGQLESPKFGEGIQFLGKDSSFFMKAAFRFQTLYNGEWEEQQLNSGFGNVSHGFLVRRSRIKMKGWIGSPKLEYKVELALSNRDQGGGLEDEFQNSPNTVLDAAIDYHFSKHFSILFGQTKLPGNRERVISSSNLQLVDRSRLNSRYNIDRDVGLQFKGNQKIGQSFIIREIFALTQGEGRNVTQGNFDGFAYTFRTEFLPFGAFTDDNDYLGSGIIREPTPKFSLGITYELNKNAVRERGHLGEFFQSESGTYFGKDMTSVFIDCMFKMGGFTLMAEYAYKDVKGGNPFIYDSSNVLLGNFLIGNGFNIMTGYDFVDNFEITMRYTSINPNQLIGNREREYTLGLSKYIYGHKLKFQTDFAYRNVIDGRDKLFYRFQTDVHF